MEKRVINPYLDKQLALESEYYSRLQFVILPFVAELVKYIESKQVSLRRLDDMCDNWINANMPLLGKINSTQAIEMVKVANLATSNGNVALPSQAHNLTTDLNIHTKNMLNAIKGRFIDLVPAGVIIVNYLLFTDEITKSDIIRRSNYSINRYVQTNTTSGIVQSIFRNAEQIGYTEYQADNQHDDRVRETHKKYFDGLKWWKFNDPSPAGHPGEEDNCRCVIIALR